MDSRKIKIGIASALIVGTITYILINRHNKKKVIKELDDLLEGNKSTEGSGSTIISKPEWDKLPDGKFPLKVESPAKASKKVYELQKNLKKNYGATVDMDGKFGQGLYNALCKYYWFFPCLYGTYDRTIESSDFDEIKNKKAETD